jgi:hypothetical protein
MGQRPGRAHAGPRSFPCATACNRPSSCGLIYRSPHGWSRLRALPASAPFPLPVPPARWEEPPVPPDALPHFMDAIQGDGSPWSYLSASIFMREAEEIGARWHAVNWGAVTVLGENPLEAPPADSGSDLLSDSVAPEEWSWRDDLWGHERPEEWRPSVRFDEDSVVVTFHAFTALGGETISRHVDRYRRGRYRPECAEFEIATGGLGYIP